MTVIVLTLYFVSFVVDYLPNAKKQRRGDNLVYCALLSASFVILMLYSLGIVVPGPTAPIKHIVELFIKPA